MVLTPKSSSMSRLSLLKNSSRSNASQNKSDDHMNTFLEKFKPMIPQQQHSVIQRQTADKQTITTNNKPIASTSQNTSLNSDKILNGVIACLDVRTEDGDDVSQNFERALQSMGAKTRRTFSDSVTHLIFKNGSTTTLKKAMNKNVFIINLLWISKCKQEGRRLPETDFIIEKPQGLVLANKKRRKSMEPSKVKALVLKDTEEESALSSSSEESVYEDYTERKSIILNKDIKKSYSLESQLRKRHIEELEEESNSDSVKLSIPSTSTRQITQQKEFKLENLTANAPNMQKQEQIKARFSIGGQALLKNISVIEDETAQLSISSPTLGKKKRRLTLSTSKPLFISANELVKKPIVLHSTTPTNSSPIFKFDFTNHLNKPKPHTIVLTSMFTPIRKKCEEAIQKLGQYELASQVTDHTTHVLVGAQRRTTSVTLGLLKGAWILNPEWLIQSLSNGKYLSENQFELLKWYPRADIARRGLKLFSPSLSISIYSSTNQLDFLKNLVQLSGASLVENYQEAGIIICEENCIPDDTMKNIVKDNWLFESIEQWRCKITN